MDWYVNYFKHINDAVMTKDQFIKYLGTINERYHDVKAILLSLEGSINLYLRVENWHGSFLVEMFNPQCPAREYLALREILKIFNPVEGYMPTVVDSQYNYAFICSNKSGPPICQPVEFIYRCTSKSEETFYL